MNEYDLAVILQGHMNFVGSATHAIWVKISILNYKPISRKEVKNENWNLFDRKIIQFINDNWSQSFYGFCFTRRTPKNTRFWNIYKRYYFWSSYWKTDFCSRDGPRFGVQVVDRVNARFILNRGARRTPLKGPIATVPTVLPHQLVNCVNITEAYNQTVKKLINHVPTSSAILRDSKVLARYDKDGLFYPAIVQEPFQNPKIVCW